MRPIPAKLRQQMANLEYYKRCCVCNTFGVQWHHNLIFGGVQQNFMFCILPLCPECHEQARNKEFKEYLDWIMWNRATPEEIAMFSKAIDYNRELKRLNDKFGNHLQ